MILRRAQAHCAECWALRNVRQIRYPVRVKTHRRRPFLPLLLLLVLAPVSLAQNPLVPAAETTEEAPAAEPPPEELQPEAIPAPQIPRRAESLVRQLADQARIIDADRLISRGTRLEQLTERLVVEDADISSFALESTQLQAIEETQTRWRRYKSTLDRWGDEMGSESEHLAEIRADLEFWRSEWELTRGVGRTRQYPAEVMERVEASLKAIGDQSRGLQQQIDDLLILQSRVSAQATRADEILQQLNRSQTLATRNLFYPEAAPIWRPSKVVPDLTGEMVESWRYRQESLIDFVADSAVQLRTHGLIVLALLIGIPLIRRRPEIQAIGEDSLGGAQHLLKRPISTALLIGLLLLPLLYDPLPTAITELALLAAFIPLLRLLPPMLPKRFHVAVYGAAALYVFHAVTRLVEPGTGVHRWLLLLTTSLAIAGVVLVYRSWYREPPFGRFQGLVLGVLKLWALALLVSVPANIVGSVSLAALLLRGVVYSAYAAAILFACDRAVNGLATVLTRTRLARSLRIVRRHGEVFAPRREFAVHVVLVFLWFRGTLRILRVWDLVVDWITGVLTYTWTAGSVEFSLGDVLLFVATLWATVMISRAIRLVVEEELVQRVELPRGIPATISQMVHYAVMTLGLLVAFAAAGFELGRFAVVVGALGVGIGFGLQTLVNNFVSGLILIFERPIKVGDKIEVAGVFGDVKRIGIRASIITTLDGAELIVPNGTLVATEVTNWTLSDRQRRIEVPVGVAYGTDDKVVIELLLRVARGHTGLKSNPEPVAVFVGFGESSLDFSLRAWTANFDDWVRIRSELMSAIHAALNEAGIEIPFPQRDLHVRSGLPDAPPRDSDTTQAMPGDQPDR